MTARLRVQITAVAATFWREWNAITLVSLGLGAKINQEPFTVIAQVFIWDVKPHKSKPYNIVRCAWFQSKGAVTQFQVVTGQQPKLGLCYYSSDRSSKWKAVSTTEHYSRLEEAPTEQACRTVLFFLFSKSQWLNQRNLNFFIFFRIYYFVKHKVLVSRSSSPRYVSDVL